MTNYTRFSRTLTCPGPTLDDGKTVPLEVKAGDPLIVGKYSGSEVKLDETEYVILREDDVLGIIK